MALLNEDSVFSIVRLAADYGRNCLPEDVRQNAQVVAANNATLFGKVLQLVQALLRHGDSSSIPLLTDYLSGLMISRGCIDECVLLLEGMRKQLPSRLIIAQPHKPSITDVRWRLDITISSSVLARVLEPNLIMEWQLSDGRKVMFEVSVAKFHKLRFTVASILKEMNAIQVKLNSIKL